MAPKTRLLSLSLALATLSIAAGIVDPVEPFAANHLFVVDGGTSILEFDELGELQPTYLTGNLDAEDVAFGPEGALYAADFAAHLIRVYDSESGDAVAEIGAGSGLLGPRDLAFGPGGDLFVASGLGNEVLRYDCDGLFVDALGAGSGLLDPRGLAFAPDGHVFVSSFGSDEVLEFDGSGTLLGVSGFGSGLDGPYGLAFSPRNGLLHVASHHTDQVLVFDADTGAQVGSFGAGSDLDGPTSISFGPDGLLYVASSGTGEVLAFREDGAFDRSLGGGDLGEPSGLAFAPFILGATVKGRLHPLGGEMVKFKRRARINWAPGSGRASVLLLPGLDDDVEALFGDPALVATGFESRPTNPGPQVRYVGQELDASSLMDGIGVLAFNARGKAVNLTGIKSLTGLFSPNKIVGEFHRSSPAGSVEAEFKAKK